MFFLSYEVFLLGWVVVTTETSCPSYLNHKFQLKYTHKNLRRGDWLQARLPLDPGLSEDFANKIYLPQTVYPKMLVSGATLQSCFILDSCLWIQPKIRCDFVRKNNQHECYQLYCLMLRMDGDKTPSNHTTKPFVKKSPNFNQIAPSHVCTSIYTNGPAKVVVEPISTHTTSSSTLLLPYGEVWVGNVIPRKPVNFIIRRNERHQNTAKISHPPSS